jgi:hypothetical protein
VSAAALRAPARWPDAVRAEIGVLASVRPAAWILLFFLIAVGSGFSEYPIRENQAPYGVFRFAVVMMFLLPLAWQGRGGTAGEAPLPVADSCRTLVRVLTGAVFAGLVFGLGIGFYVLGARFAFAAANEANSLHTFPASYPVVLILAGVAHYLLGAALMLRAERPGRVLLASLCVGALVLAAVGIQLEHVEWEVYGPWDERRFRGSTSLTLNAALLRLSLGVAAVGVAAWWAGPHSQRWHGRARLRARFPEPRRAQSVPLAVPRPPTPAAAVFVRHLLLLAPRMLVPVLLTLLLAWFLEPGELSYEDDGVKILSTDPLYGLWFIAFLWPVLVWLDEGRIRPWDQARPAGIPAQRLMHATAGLVWLAGVTLVYAAGYMSRAMEAGLLASPADLHAWFWLGLPLAVLAVYSLGTISAVLAGRPLAAGILGCMFLLPLLSIIDSTLNGNFGDAPPPGPVGMLAPLGWVHSHEWSLPAAFLCTPLLVAAAVGALRLRAWRDLRGRNPRVREVVRHFGRARSATRAAPPVAS